MSISRSHFRTAVSQSVQAGRAADGCRALDQPAPGRRAIVARVNGELWDLNRPLNPIRRSKFSRPKNPEALEVYRHSTAHLLAAAVLELFPETKLGIGPPIETGFYYDFQRPEPFTPEDLEKIEKRMWEIQARDLPYERKYTKKDEGLKLYADQPMKVELITERAGDIFSEYTLGPGFIDFCRGPHVPSTKKIKAFKLLSVAGAYWKGSEKNAQLQRIYGTAFFTQKGSGRLSASARRSQEARSSQARQGAGAVHGERSRSARGCRCGFPRARPSGGCWRNILLRTERERGYQHVYTPDLAKVDLYMRSGHWEHYHEDMFPPMELENEQMVLRPMNCPHHILIYESKMRSYRELPVRLAELGTMYRYERSGVLSGLSRVRCMTLNDAHIFCTPEQIKEEFTDVMQLVERAYKRSGHHEVSATGCRCAIRRTKKNMSTTTRCGNWASACCAKRWTRWGCRIKEAQAKRRFTGRSSIFSSPT